MDGVFGSKFPRFEPGNADTAADGRDDAATATDDKEAADEAGLGLNGAESEGDGERGAGGQQNHGCGAEECRDAQEDGGSTQASDAGAKLGAKDFITCFDEAFDVVPELVKLGLESGFGFHD
jgi:hypothetical protein